MPDLRPYREQEPFLQDDKRYYGFVSGVGAGKTFAGILRVAANVERWNPGEMGAIVAPTSKNIRDVIIPEMRELGLLEHWEYRGKSAEEPGLHAPNGARVILEGADNRRKIERLRGFNLAWWWMDEASTVDRRAYDILVGRLRAGEYRNGFVTTTPKGQNWVHEEFVPDDATVEEYGAAEVATTADTTSVLQVPSHANPHTPTDYTDSLEAKYEGAFYRQEVLGEFTRFEGLVYPWFREEEHVLDADEAPERFDRILYGVDWGFANPSVILAVGLRDGQPIVLDEVYEPRLTVDDVAGEMGALQDAHGQGTVYADPAEPASIQSLRKAGFDAVAAENDVTPGIQCVSAHRDDLRVVERCEHLIDEFGAYRYRDDGDSDDPVKEQDHAMDALRYALFSQAQSVGEVGVASASVGTDDGPDLPFLQ